MTERNEQDRTFSYVTIWQNIEEEARRKIINTFSRRDFLKLSIAALAATTLFNVPYLRRAGFVQAQEDLSAAGDLPRRLTSFTGTLPNGVAAGDITRTSAVLWARSAVVGEVTFRVSSDADFREIVREETVSVQDPMLPAKAFAQDLEPGTTYYYDVTSPEGETLAGTFRTPWESGRKGFRLGVTGDWRGELRPYPGVRNAADANLDLFVLHGDTIYADIPSLDFTEEQAATLGEYRIKHNEVYRERFGINDWAAVRAAVATLATIDDHEVTNDFAGAAHPETDPRFPQDEGVERISETSLYVNGLQAFREYNPTRSIDYGDTGDPRMDGKPQLYRYIPYGEDAAVILLDARSFRDAAVPAVINFFDPEEVAAYNQNAWQEGRTMLGQRQYADLTRDVLDAHERGITWKFILIPEPMQMMGFLGGSDRWEGYAPERTRFMQFVEANGITNVVFVSADIHSTFINEITYQTAPDGEQIRTGAFEITTGSVGFFPPTGAALVEGAREFDLLPRIQEIGYDNADISGKDAILEFLFNQSVNGLQGFVPLGFAGSQIDAEFLSGRTVAGHSFGWAEFDVDAETQVLTVTTYGVPAYSPQQMADDPDTFANLVPQVLSQFRVNPA